MYRVRPLLLVLACIGLLVAACAAPASPIATPTSAPSSPTSKPAAVAPTPAPATATPGLITVKVLVTGSILSESVNFVAKDKGYFAQEGIDAQFVVIPNIETAMAPLSTGELDVVSGAWAMTLGNAIQRGIPLKIVGAKLGNLPGFSIYRVSVRKDLYDSGKIREIGDLKGKKVAVPSMSSAGPAFARLLQEAKLTLKDADFVAMGHADMVAAFTNKAIDAAMLAEPLRTKAVDDGLVVRMWNLYGFDEGPNAVVIAFGPKFGQNAEGGKRFMTAYIRAARDYADAFLKNKGKKEVIDILVKNTDVKDPSLYEKMDMPGVNPDGYADKKAMDWAIQYWLSTGELKERIDLDKVVDNSFVDAALQKLGKYAR